VKKGEASDRCLHLLDRILGSLLFPFYAMSTTIPWQPRAFPRALEPARLRSATLSSTGGTRRASKTAIRASWAHDVCDTIMPKMNGYELFLALREVNPGIKAILCSGYALYNQVQEALGAGAMGFVKKPFTAADLSREITRVMFGWGAPRRGAP